MPTDQLNPLDEVVIRLAQDGHTSQALEVLAIRMPLRGRDPLELLKSKFRNWHPQRRRIAYLDALWPAFEQVYNRINAVPLRAKLPAFYVDDSNALFTELKGSGRWVELPAAGARRLFITKKVQTDKVSFHPRGDLVLALLIQRNVIWLFLAHRAALTALKDPKTKTKPKVLTQLFVIPGRTEFTQEGGSSYLWFAGSGVGPYHTVVSVGKPDPGVKTEIDLDMDIDEFIRWYDYQYSRGRVGDIRVQNVDALHEDDRNKLELWLRRNRIKYTFRT
jgi:hypothetical protein